MYKKILNLTYFFQVMQFLQLFEKDNSLVLCSIQIFDVYL